MAADLRSASGLRVPVDSLLSEESRRRVYEENVQEAKRRLETNDLERALEAARRAQAVEPSGREVVKLIEGIEARFDPTEITPRPTERTPRPTPSSVVTRIRALGAAVYRDLGTFGEPPPTQTMAFSPAREVLALAGTDGAVRLWDLAARRRLVVLSTEMHKRTGHDARAVCLTFSPDGKILAVGHIDGAIHLFDVTRGVEFKVKLRHEEMVTSLAFTPNGMTLASGGTDTNLKLWDVTDCRNGEARRELYRQPSAMTSLAYAGRLIVTAHTNRTLRVLDGLSLRLTATLRGPDAPVNLMRVDPAGRQLMTGSQDRMLRVFNLQTNAAPLSLGPFRKALSSACFFADGRHLVTVNLENVVQIWDLESREVVASLYGSAEDAFVGVALCGSSEQLVVSMADGRIRLFGPA
ncbi:MAG: WD40 repeat domain-containing protein [Vicinamibacteria bacterium]